MSFLLALLTMSAAYAGDVLFIDLNNSTEEISHCINGVDAENARYPGTRKDKVAILGVGDEVNPQNIEKMIARKEASGYSFDTIIISGHDGSGHFFGENGNILASEIGDIVERRSQAVEAHDAETGDTKVPLNQSLTGMALWGCYTTTGAACENYWMKNISPSIKATLGFTMQSPDNTNAGNWALLEDYCKKRSEIAAASTQQEMSEVFKGLSGIGHWNSSICFKATACAPADYGRDPVTAMALAFTPTGNSTTAAANSI